MTVLYVGGGIQYMSDQAAIEYNRRQPGYSAYSHGFDNAKLDAIENNPFGVIGGLGCRWNFQRPGYIPPEDAGEFFRGYADAARRMYGDDWRTCAFGWASAITIERG